MAPLESRRKFIINLAGLAAYATVPRRALCALVGPPLYPPTDLSCFDRPITPAPSEIRFGYAAITWGGHDTEAINDISEVGFHGIQLRASAVRDFGDKPAALAELLKQHHLQFVALSGGGPTSNEYQESDEVAAQVKNAAFLRAAGGMHLQMTDASRPKGRAPSADDYKKLGRLLTEVGKRTIDMGIAMAYHNHVGSLGQSPEEIDRLMDACDARYAKLLLDVAHYTQGGGDPAKAIRKYRDRILFLHIKDVESRPKGSAENGSEDFRFVELGRGRVDLPGVFAALKEIRFRGWAMVELDSVPDNARTPKESAIISKRYLEEKLKMKI